ncbi:hypothetical protein PAPYR_12180 [Paratrimastix pyriformis]|uniref:Uncharacterized protein n=1 Tax=Paratrimastix pyriformis TaxID=342808 RepID=A0ABQ8U289_9EUKA|nr:hypothetical protein PAPYR_12180 [Paratrimastix pyriformis]
MTSHEMARQRDAIKKEMNWMFRWNADVLLGQTGASTGTSETSRCPPSRGSPAPLPPQEPMPPPPNPDEMLRTRGTQAFIASKVLFQTVQERFPEGPALTSHEYGWKRPDPEITPPSRCGRRNALSGTRLTAQESPSHFGALRQDPIDTAEETLGHSKARQTAESGVSHPASARRPPVLRGPRRRASVQPADRPPGRRRECDLLRATAEREGLDIQTTLVRLLDSVGLPLECPLIAPPAELVAGFASADF